MELSAPFSGSNDPRLIYAFSSIINLVCLSAVVFSGGLASLSDVNPHMGGEMKKGSVYTDLGGP